MAGTVALLLAGLIDEPAAAGRLGLAPGQLEPILAELGLSQAAMVPVALGPGPDVRYADIGHDAFAASMFDHVVEHHAGADGGGSSPRFSLSAEAILAAAQAGGRHGPQGLMFHTGRSGSTLLCNLLSADPGCVALREPEVLNGVLRRMADTPDPGACERLGRLSVALLHSLAHGVRADAQGRARAAVVKLTSWTAGLAGPLVTAFDAVPIVVVVRDPWASVASFLRQPPHWAGSSRAPQGFAEAWNGAVDAAMRFPADRTLFVAYADLVAAPAATLKTVRRHFRLAGDEPRASRVDAIMGAYSKGAPGEGFDAAGRHLCAELDAPLSDLVTRLSGDRWRRLQRRLPSADRRAPSGVRGAAVAQADL